MSKHKKKKKHAQLDQLADDPFSVAAQSIKKFRKVTNEIAKLSPGQKLAGGLVLVAAGFLYLERHRIGAAVEAAVPDRASWPRLLTPDGAATATEETEYELPQQAPAPPKRRKPAKPAKGRAGRQPERQFV